MIRPASSALSPAGGIELDSRLGIDVPEHLDYCRDYHVASFRVSHVCLPFDQLQAHRRRRATFTRDLALAPRSLERFLDLSLELPPEPLDADPLSDPCER